MNADTGAPPASPAEAGPEDSSPLSPAPTSWKFVPEDLQVPWGMRELLLFLAVFLLMAYATAVVVSLGLMTLHVTHGFVPRAPRERSVFLLVNQVLLSAGAILYLYLRLRVHFHAPFWRTLQWRVLNPQGVSKALAYAGCVGGGCTMALVIGFLGARLGKATSAPIEEFFKTRDTALVLLSLSIFVAPLVEETIFRGFLYPALARRTGVLMGVLLTGTLFGLMHSYQLGGSTGRVALLIFVGIVLTWVRASTRSVLASYLVHLSYNSFLAAGYLLSRVFYQLPPHH